MLNTVNPTDFFAVLDEVNSQLGGGHLPRGITFQEVGRQWTEQGGLPLVDVHRNYSSGVVYISQEPYIRDYREIPRWWIPLTWSTGSTVDSSPLEGPQDWLYEDKVLNLNINPSDWLLVNINSTGWSSSS